MSIPDEQFYDKVASKFGGYKSGVTRTNKFINGDPEKIFLAQLLNCAGIDKIALDIGCADGRFTLKVAQNFKQIIAVDVSERMLDAAKQLQAEQKISNVQFQKTDAAGTPFADEYFDVVYSRRAPTPYQEIIRVVKESGCYAEIRIGGKDARELKEIFGRGQGFGDWNDSDILARGTRLEAIGLKPIFMKEYLFSEYYPDIDNLSHWLESVPIFKDFNPAKDRDLLSKYVKKMNTQDGIELKRHRVVIVAKKLEFDGTKP